MEDRICSVAGCRQDVLARNLCNTHYLRLRRHGDPLGGSKRFNKPANIPWVDYFWSFVNIAGPDECWDWTGAPSAYGYGVINRIKAHRFSYELAFGPIPDGLMVRHYVCGRPICVNPAHLKPGTQADNMKDMMEHGRSRRGEERATVLTEEIVREARRRRAAGESISQFARELGVKQQTLNSAAIGETWKYLE